MRYIGYGERQQRLTLLAAADLQLGLQLRKLDRLLELLRELLGRWLRDRLSEVKLPVTSDRDTAA